MYLICASFSPDSLHSCSYTPMDSELSRLCESVSAKCTRLRSFTEQIRSLAGQLGSTRDSEELRDKLHGRQHEALQLAAELVRCVSDLEA